MRKILKVIGILIGLIIVLSLIAIFAVVKFFNPNDYKDKISAQVYQHTGRQLSLNGDIQWSFFPWLGLQINQAQLSDAKGFSNQPFAQIQQIDVKVKLIPLFSHKVEVDKILLNGLELHLIKNAQGVGNWQNLVQSSTAKNAPVAVDSANTTATQKSSWLSPMAFVIAGVDVNNGHITLVDKQQKQSFDISNLQLKSNTVQLGQAFPVDLQFTLKSTNPVINSNVKLDAMITVSADKQFSAQGNLAVDAIKLYKVNLSNINAKFNILNNLFNFNPITADLYQGKYVGSFTLDVRGKVPKITNDAQLTGIQSEALFQDMTDITRIKINGVDNLQVHLTTQGASSAALMSNLSGLGKMSVKNGVLKGIDIPYFINAGKALLNKQVPSQTQSGQTNFGNLTASFAISNGVVSNNDLLLQAPSLQVTGKGTANINKEYLDYVIIAQAVHPDTHSPDSIAIPIKIFGPFANLTVRPDLNSLLQSQIQQQLDQQKDKLKKRINIEIGKRLNNVLGDQLKDQLNSLFK